MAKVHLMDLELGNLDSLDSSKPYNEKCGFHLMAKVHLMDLGLGNLNSLDGSKPYNEKCCFHPMAKVHLMDDIITFPKLR